MGGAPLEEYPDEAWEKVFNLNVRHLFNLTVQLLPLLAKAADRERADPARVVNISSVDGVRPLQTFGPNAASAYSASKAAVIHLTKAMARAMTREYYITANCIAPGAFPS